MIQNISLSAYTLQGFNSGSTHHAKHSIYYIIGGNVLLFTDSSPALWVSGIRQAMHADCLDVARSTASLAV